MEIKLKRGTEATIPTLQEGEPGFTTDSKKLFIGSTDGNIEIGGAALLLKENKSEKGVAGGYASLDSEAKIPSSQLPDSILGQLEYKGTFNPSSGYPVSPEKGWYYISIGNAAISGVDYKVGDWAVYNGASWDKIDNTDTTALVEVTWQELKNKRDADELIPSQQYRITDYVTTTHQEFTRSAGHQFDIIVTADSADKLNENARACLHEGDTYFANSKLEAWQLKYCLDNDATRFAWADNVSGSGKGVIYQMIDEFNNDVPYDFKNIQYTNIPAAVGELTSAYYYTFSMIDNALIMDATNFVKTKPETYTNAKCLGNIIKPLFTQNSGGPGRPSFNGPVILNKNIFFGKYMTFSGGATGYHTHCYNSFGFNCSENYIMAKSDSNIFGDNCQNNTFGNDCYYNTFGNNCSSNTFGDACSSNTLGYSCSQNTFGSNCTSNTFGYGCHSNTFGNNSSYNTFGNQCSANAFDNSCSSNTFGNGCQYLKISDISSTNKKHIHVDNGTQGASSANKFDLYDSAILNKGYQVTFKKDADGRYVMTWLDDYEKLEGKYKANNLDITWKNLPHDIDGGVW